jgi:hypothetical protein
MTDWRDFLKRGGLTLNVNLNVTGAGAVGLGPVLEALTALMGKVDRMAGELDRIETELSELTDAGEGMKLLLETLAAEIRANANNAARMTQIADKMDAKGKAWVDATLANTPAAELPPDGPPPEDTPEASFKRK